MTEALVLLIRANLALAVAVGLILMLRPAVRRLAGARAAYTLWSVAPLAAAACLIPADAPPIPIVLPEALIRALPQVHGPVTAFNLPLATIALWIAGALVGAAFTVWRHRKMVAGLGRLSLRPDGALEAQARGVGPAVLGALRPRIIVPADFDARFDAAERAVILAHEQTHLRAGDAQANAMVVLMQCLFWFNPLVHLAAHLARQDQELACDQTVLAAHPEKKRIYAETLLKTQLSSTSVALGCAWPARRRHPLNQRLFMLRIGRPGQLRRLAGGAAITLVCWGAAFTAWAAAPVEAARAVAEFALGDPKLLKGQIMRVSRMVGLTQLAVNEEGEVWTVTGAGARGKELATLAAASGEIAIDGLVAKDGACGAANCIVRGDRPTPRRLAGVSEAGLRLSPDAAAPVFLKGELTSVRWIHPNAMIHLKQADGSTWRVGGVTTAALSRGGLTREELLPGREIVVNGFRSTDRTCAPECRAVGVDLTLAGWVRHPLWRYE